ncbi:MAG: nucleoside permease [Flammeovirgaceae bacterium]|nr:nucleoside permease [Flammeovirgaceae bacterium]
MNLKLRFQLSTMMFLNYFIWGAWYVTMGTYLGSTLSFSGAEIGVLFGAVSVAALVSPFFVGMIADRFFATEKILSFLHFIGGILFILIANATEFSWFYLFFQIYMLCFMPTVALTNSLSFRNLKDPNGEFPGIRVLGTLGFIAAMNIISHFELEESEMMFILAAMSSFALGFFSLFLPKTPPKEKGQKVTISDVLGLKAVGLLKEKSFLIFFIASVLICIPLAFYYAWANPFLNELGMEKAASKMSWGQVSETLFLLVMPFFFRKLGVKWMLVVAMISWGLRYFLFAFGDLGGLEWMLYGGIILHGICYDFFFVTGQIYVDNKAGEEAKGAAQGLITFATYGLGMLIGSYISGWIVDYYIAADGLAHNWKEIWMVPALGAMGVLLLFVFFFTEKSEEEKVEVNA